MLGGSRNPRLAPEGSFFDGFFLNWKKIVTAQCEYE